jgi:type IV pilus assembly protein PilM
MASARSAWGIDVGNRALKAVRLVRTGGGVAIDDVDIIEHEHVLSHAGDNKESLIQASLTTFVARHNLKGTPVAVGVSGQSSFARFIALPPVEPKKIPEIVRFEAIQQIPFPLEEVEWAYQLFKEPESPDVEVGIFAMRRELVNNYVKFFTDAGLNVEAVQMNPLAVYNALYHDGKTADATTMMIDLGAEHTDLIIAEGERVWMRPIPIGGNNFTEALVKAFKLRFEKAEELKRNAATSKYGRQILQAMRPVFADLVSEIQRSIGFYSSSHRDSKISRIIALGGTFRLPGLQKYLQQNLQLEVQRLDQLGAAAPSDPKVASTLGDNLLSSVGAYGLALQAMGQAKISSSLLPQHIRRERLWKDKTKWFAAAAALFVVGAVGVPLAVYGLNTIKFSEARPNFDKARQKAGEFQQLDQQWANEVEGAGAADREQVMTIMGLTTGRGVWAPLTVDIASALPEPSPNLRTRDVAQITKVPRADRNFVWVDEWTTRYEPNIDQFLAPKMDKTKFIRAAANKGGTGGGSASLQATATPAPAAEGEGAAAQPQRGFLITLWCKTPSKDYFNIAQKIAQEMVKTNQLPAGAAGAVAGQAAARGGSYRIERVEVVLANKLQPDAAQTPGGIQNRFQGGGAGGGFQGAQGTPYTPPPGFFGQGSTFNGPGPGAGAYPNYGARGGQSPYGPNYGGAQPNAATGPADQPRYQMPQIPELNPQANIQQVIDPSDAFKDPVTGESTKDDYQLQFLIAVVLDPQPPKPAEGTAPAAGQQTAAATVR